MKKKLLRAAAVAVLGVSMTTGLAAAQSGSINQTGQSSENRVRNRVTTSRTVTSDVTAGISNGNNQGTSTGTATANNNTTGGSVSSGMASNSNAFGLNATINNSMASTAAGGSGMAMESDNSGTISNTGQGSTNVVHNTVNDTTTVDTSTNLQVSSTSTQSASSGNASASNNTTVGDVWSGDAMNTNTSSIVLTITQ